LKYHCREVLKTRIDILGSEIDKHINSIWSKEQLPQQREGFVVLFTYKNFDKTYCSNYGWISLLPTTYKILTNILF